MALALAGGVLLLGCSTTRPAGDAPSVRGDTIAVSALFDASALMGERDTIRLERLPPATLRRPGADTLRRPREAGRRPGVGPRPPSAGADTATANRAYVDADSLSAFMRNGERLQELMGNVFVRQDSTRLRSARALRYLQRDETVFTDRVRIVERGDTLWADTVRYDQQRKIGYARGNVRLTDGDITVLAPRADYYNREKYAAFPDTITLVDSSRTLRASAGEYFSDAKRAEFYGLVRLVDDNTAVEADSLTYYREDKVSLAYGDVFIERGPRRADPAAEPGDRTYLFGQQARLEEDRDYSRVTGNTLLIQVRTDSAGASSDTLLVASQQMEATRADTLRRLVAVGAVRIWQSDIAAAADSAVYDRIPAPDTTQTEAPPYEETRLYQEPISWFEETQVTGDTIRVVVRDRSIDSVYVESDAFAAQLDTASQRIQQLKGRSMVASFRNDSLRRLVARPNAQTIYFRTNETGELDGAGKTSGDRVVMAFRDGTLKEARVYGGIQLSSWKGPQVPENLSLQGLQWQPERRPTKSEFLRQPRVQRYLPAFGRPPALADERPEADSTAPAPDRMPYDTLRTAPTAPRDTTRTRSPEPGSRVGSGRSPQENDSGAHPLPLLRTPSRLQP